MSRETITTIRCDKCRKPVTERTLYRGVVWDRYLRELSADAARTTLLDAAELCATCYLELLEAHKEKVLKEAEWVDLSFGIDRATVEKLFDKEGQ